MKIFCNLTLQTIRILLKDRVFVFFVAFQFVFFLGMISLAQGILENPRTFILRTSYAEVLFSLLILALFLGTRMIQDTKQEGALEVQLAAPVRRSTWFISQWLGLSLALFLTAFCSVMILNAYLYFLDFNALSALEYWHGFFIVLTAWIVAAVSFFMSSFTKTPVALFASLTFTILGMISQSLIDVIVLDSVSASIIAFCRQLSVVWNFQKLYVLDYAFNHIAVTGQQLGYQTAYGLGLALFFVCFGALIFSKKDIV